MIAFVVARNVGTIDREDTPYHGYVRLAGDPIGQWYGYLVSGTGPQLLALDALDNVEGLVAVRTGDGGLHWPEEDMEANLRVRLNTWLTNRGYETFPEGLTYKQWVIRLFRLFNKDFTLNRFSVKEP